MPDEFDLMDTCPIEYITESEKDYNDDDDFEDGWDDEDSDEEVDVKDTIVFGELE